MSCVDKSAAWRKRFETMKRDGKIRQSSIEDKVYHVLCNKFGSEDVKRQVLMNDRWPIDFYIKSLDIYVQFDGKYWHGLDRPLEVIAEHKTSQDIVIHKKWMTDKEQDAWFESNGLRLLRVSDASDDALHRFVDLLATREEKEKYVGK